MFGWQNKMCVSPNETISKSMTVWGSVSMNLIVTPSENVIINMSVSIN